MEAVGVSVIVILAETKHVSYAGRSQHVVGVLQVRETAHLVVAAVVGKLAAALRQQAVPERISQSIPIERQGY